MKAADNVRTMMMLGSAIPAERERAALVLRKQDLIEELAQCKKSLGRAKSDAYVSGKFIAASQFRALEARVLDIPTELMAIDAQLRGIKQAAKERRDMSQRSREERFVEMSKEYLTKDQFMEIWDRLDAEDEGDADE